MINRKNEIKATFHVLETTDKSRFQSAVRAVYAGEASDEDQAYVLDNTAKIVCGHDPEVMAAAGRKRWTDTPRMIPQHG